MQMLTPLAMVFPSQYGSVAEVAPPPPATVPTGHTALDPAKTSPCLTLSNGGLTVVGSNHFGNAASIAPMPAQSWFEVTIDKLAGDIFMGACTASHFFGSDGAAWGGGDPHLTAIYTDAGGGWLPGTGYAMHEDDAGMASAVGTRWMVERDASKAKDSYGNPAPNGVVRVRRPDFVSRDYAAPLGTLYAIIGFNPAPSQVTVNFGATAPANPITPGYVAP